MHKIIHKSMKFLFITDLLVAISAFVMAWILPQFTMSMFVGSCVHLFVRSCMDAGALMLWVDDSSADRWRNLLSKKDYLTEIIVSIMLMFLFLVIAKLLWSPFFTPATMLALWAVSQIIELIFLKSTK